METQRGEKGNSGGLWIIQQSTEQRMPGCEGAGRKNVLEGKRGSHHVGLGILPVPSSQTAELGKTLAVLPS